jgi:uncharacterized phiE125 gp8 family phage protein
MIDVDAAKAWIKKETADEDTLIEGLVNAAVATVEAQTGKNMSAKAFTQTLDRFPCDYPYSIRLRRGPVTEIASIEYDPSDGSDAATIGEYRLTEGFGAAFNGALQPAYGAVWPVPLDGSAVVRITGTAGYADGEAPDLDQAALMLVAHWYQNREAVNVGNLTTEIPLAVQMLLQPYRPSGLA